MSSPDGAGTLLGRAFYNRDVVQVARDLLGCLLLRDSREGLTAGIIVEVEAYLAQGDPANHAFRGPNRKNASMFGPPGHAYVYPIHSRFCLNVVTEPEGVPSAVLIRAIEPTEGIELMRRRRKARSGSQEVADLDLARGPARLCEALAIDRTLDGWDLTSGRVLWIEARSGTAARQNLPVVVTTRVGVTAAADLPLRFYLSDCPFVSRRA
jgi:DNA-3-methyladenine glycosylase